MHSTPSKGRKSQICLQETCHNVGLPAGDGSIGQCSKCHLRHEFSLEQARASRDLQRCHIGPIAPQWEIYRESPHGVAYAGGDRWHCRTWHLSPSRTSPRPPAPPVRFSGFGASGTTHDAGDRLTWFLYHAHQRTSPRLARPTWCACRASAECHNQEFVNTFYTDADAATEKVNSWVAESNR
ncbi:MAG: multiheme c-type cytochrome [Caldilineaceae bacterium]